LSVFDDESGNELADTQNTSIGLHPILQQFSYVEHSYIEHYLRVCLPLFCVCGRWWNTLKCTSFTVFILSYTVCMLHCAGYRYS